ncbi:hypothetical protein K2X33_05290 [bacterium]|nr:hypothetical protein [bacterium]
MKNLFTALFLISAAAPAFGKEAKCQVADQNNNGAKPVVVDAISGAFQYTHQVTTFGNTKIWVEHQKGDQFEPETSLTMNVDGVDYVTVRVSEKGLYQVRNSQIFLQCWFE